ncbi:MAG: hypothetical protein R3F43_21290 [bacterium]
MGTGGPDGRVPGLGVGAGVRDRSGVGDGGVGLGAPVRHVDSGDPGAGVILGACAEEHAQGGDGEEEGRLPPRAGSGGSRRRV